MFKALNGDGEPVCAEDAKAGEAYRCPVCGKAVRLRKGQVKVAHFAHLPGEECPYGEDGDYMSEWHMRMQGYFPVEVREVVFKDDETGEVHRADVFLAEGNTVIEFQKSNITPEEFLRRTRFHLKEGRRVAWVFDESRDGRARRGDLGKLRGDGSFSYWYLPPYDELGFRWLDRRKCLPAGGDDLDIDLLRPRSDYAVFVYAGAEGGDCIRRIVHEDFGYEHVVLSAAVLEMGHTLDPDDLFRDELGWLAELGQGGGGKHGARPAIPFNLVRCRDCGRTSADVGVLRRKDWECCLGLCKRCAAIRVDQRRNR